MTDEGGVASEDSAVGKTAWTESRSKASDRACPFGKLRAGSELAEGSVRPTRVDAREAFHVECGVVVALCRLVWELRRRLRCARLGGRLRLS